MHLQALADQRALPLDESQESSQSVRLPKCKGIRGVVVDPCAMWRDTSAVKVRLALHAHLPPDSCEGGQRGADDTPHTHSVLSVAADESSECSEAVSREPAAVSRASSAAVGDASRASAARARADVGADVGADDVGGTCTFHFHRSELQKIYLSGSIVVVPETSQYRALAISQVTTRDRVLEIGCDFGVCTAILARQASHALGVDISAARVQKASQTYGHVADFEVLDCLSDLEGLTRVPASRNKFFIDINGNRSADTVLQAIANLQHVVKMMPDIVVVKSRELYKLLRRHPSLLSLQSPSHAPPTLCLP